MILEKGVRDLLPERPEGCFAQKVPATFPPINVFSPILARAGLEHLKGLTNLRTLDLRETWVTNEGVKKLQGALPNCKIQQ